jgi:hypothetical protein
MLQGGNGRARDFFVKNKTPMDGKINEKYTSRTASMYKQELLKSVADDMKKNSKLYASNSAATSSPADAAKPAQKKVHNHACGQISSLVCINVRVLVGARSVELTCLLTVSLAQKKVHNHAYGQISSLVLREFMFFI